MDKNAKLKDFIGISLIILLFSIAMVYALTRPIVTLESPASGTYSNDASDVDFNISYTLPSTMAENISGNLTLFLNGAKNVTYLDGSVAVHNDSEYNLTVEALPQGTYIWNVMVTNESDTGPNAKYWGADNFTLTIDTTDPDVSIISPANNVNLSLEGLTVIGIANDTYPDICSLVINDVVNQTVAYSNNTQFTFAGVNGFVDGENVNHQIKCIDLATNDGFGTNTTTNFDLGSLTIESNATNMTWFNANTGSHAINFTVRDAQMIKNCSLYGNLNRTSNVAGTWNLNETLVNSTSDLVTDTQLNFTFNTIENKKALADTNNSAGGMYIWNIKCCTETNNCEWAYSVNRTLGVDTVAPSAPYIRWVTNDYKNTTGTARKLVNVTHNLVLTDAIPEVYWQSVTDVNDVTLYLSNNQTGGSSDIYRIFTVAGTTNLAGTMTMANNTNMSLSPGEPYTEYNFWINVTDEAGNWNSSTNDTYPVMEYQYRVSRYGVNLTEDIWNPVGIARTNNVNLSAILEETGADYVAVYNTSHEFVTCTSASAATHDCRLNVSQGNVVWIYDSEDMYWDHSWWTVGAVLNPVMNREEVNNYSIGGGILNFTWNMTAGGSRWNYLAILNWSDKGLTIQDLEAQMNNSFNSSIPNSIQNKSNLDETGWSSTGPNMTYFSYHNISSNTYHPYYWAFGDPWYNTQLDFRSVIAVYLNHSIAVQFNRSGV